MMTDNLRGTATEISSQTFIIAIVILAVAIVNLLIFFGKIVWR